MKKDMTSPIRIVVQQGDALTLKADVLALKYEDNLYGVDKDAVGGYGPFFPIRTVRG